MSEEEDLDLLALQRQLDDAFLTTRPRPAFEDELWLRMQSRRPVWRRLRDGLAALIDGIREAPAVPSAAVAIVLIVVVGAGILMLSGPHFGGSASSASRLSQDGAATTYGPNAAVPQFGRLPAPANSHGPQVAAGPSSAAFDQNVYAGPATLTWTGHFDVAAANLPVFRYQEPTPATADQFAASLGAARSADVAPGGLGAYSGTNFTLVVIGSIAQPAREPIYNLSELKSAPAAPGSDPVAVATADLAAHSLVPTWSYQTEVQKIGTTVRVRFLRSFDLPSQGQASLVDGAGERYGIEVDFAADRPGSFQTGPLPLALDSADYPIINADQAVGAALTSSTSSAGATPNPKVQLSQVELVYTLVVAGDHSFYEPAFLFSGTFTDKGTTYVKRVLVPAVASSLLSP